MRLCELPILGNQLLGYLRDSYGCFRRPIVSPRLPGGSDKRTFSGAESVIP